MSNSEQSTEFFVADTIPSVIDKQSDIVSRKLKKARDTFDVRLPFPFFNFLFSCLLGNVHLFVDSCRRCCSAYYASMYNS